MEGTISSAQPERSSGSSVRLHYLDWLRVVATLGVFLFHAVHPFDFIPWEIKNVEQSMIVTLFIVFLAPWGMPGFFLMSGTGSWFSLRRRTARQYAFERVTRLLIPFIIGSLLLSPVQLYFQWRQRVDWGLFEGSLLEFFERRKLPLNPRAFGWAGYHLWFLGFLFAFSLIALPLFLWLREDTGRRFIAWLGGLCERRGGIFLFILPLLLVQFLLRPLYVAEQNWADFAFMLVFFISGYILISDERFARAIRRDRLLLLAGGIISTLAFFVMAGAGVGLVWMATPGIPGFYLIWALWSINSWCWTTVMLGVGMRYLDFSNRWLQYGQQAIVPFFLFHQPVIVTIAFYVVQWQARILVKLIVVVLCSFVVTLGLYELIIRRVGPLRVLFGMKSPRRATPRIAAG